MQTRYMKDICERIWNVFLSVISNNVYIFFRGYLYHCFICQLYSVLNLFENILIAHVERTSKHHS